jgi:hypothetical protein
MVKAKQNKLTKLKELKLLTKQLMKEYNYSKTDFVSVEFSQALAIEYASLCVKEALKQAREIVLNHAIQVKQDNDEAIKLLSGLKEELKSMQLRQNNNERDYE